MPIIGGSDSGAILDAGGGTLGAPSVDGTAHDAQVRYAGAPGTGPTSGAVALTDTTGRWFDASTSRRWVWRSADPNSPRAGETLYRTKTGLWVLWSPAPAAAPLSAVAPTFPPLIPAPSAVAGVLTTTDALAAAWLAAAGYDIPSALAATKAANEV